MDRNHPRVFHPIYDLTAQQLVDITGVDRKTARRWINQKHEMHASSRRLVELELAGRILPPDARVSVTSNKQGLLVEHGQYVLDFVELNRLWLDLRKIQEL